MIALRNFVLESVRRDVQNSFQQASFEVRTFVVLPRADLSIERTSCGHSTSLTERVFDETPMLMAAGA